MITHNMFCGEIRKISIPVSRKKNIISYGHGPDYYSMNVYCPVNGWMSSSKIQFSVSMTKHFQTYL